MPDQLPQYTLANPEDIDIQTLDPETVPDIRDLHVRADLPPRERIQDLLAQMNGNPYVFRCGELVFKTRFEGSRPFQAVLEDCLEDLD